MDRYKTILWSLTLLLLTWWIYKTPCPFQKGGVDEDVYFKVVLFSIVLSILATLLTGAKSIPEKIIAGTIISVIALIISTIAIINIIEAIYGDKTWFLWEDKHRILINSIYYALIFGMNILLWKIYLRFLQKIKLS